MQSDLEIYFAVYNRERTHQGRNMNGRTPYQAFIDGTRSTDDSLNTAG
jgi:hypothetical protein